MGVERLARKSFGIVVVLLLGIAIYFQAAGAVELVAAKALGVPPQASSVGAKNRFKARSISPRASTTSGDPILSRNPFDSVTGPLDRDPIEITAPEEVAQRVDLSDPLNAPECTDVSLNIVSESVDPQWSLAQLKGPGDAAASMRRVGDTVGKLEVAYIGFNPQKASPAVWFVGDGNFCQALLFSTEEEGASSSPMVAQAPTPAPPPRVARRMRRSSAPQVPAEISEKIQKVSETEYHVDRAVIDNILENQAQLMRSARIVPEQRDGKTVGIRLFGIRQDTLLGTLGMQNGDRLEKINGFDMASPEKALEAYARLRTATSLTVQVTRRGKPLTIEYQIK